LVTRKQGLLSRRALIARAGAAGTGWIVGARTLSRSPGSTAVAQGARKADVTIAMAADPETLDPHQNHTVLTSSMLLCILEGLLTRDPQTMAIKPQLATSYRNIDPHTWEFALRRGVKFSNGEEFNADTVKFNFERMYNTSLPTFAAGTVWPPTFGQKAVVVDPYTVRITTEVPDPLVPVKLADEAALPMGAPSALAPFRDKFTSNGTIGTGPFRFVEFVVGDRFVVEANPAYWGRKAASQRVIWKIIPDPATQFAALQRGSIDLMTGLPIPLISSVQNDSTLKVYTTASSLAHVLLLNTKDPGPLQDRRVRQALNYAVDRQAILKNLFEGRGQLLTSVVARQIPGAIDPGAYPYDPAKAKELLAAAGYANGFDFTLWQSTGRLPQAVETAQALAGYFQKVGARANVQTLEIGEYNKRTILSQFHGAIYYAFINGLWDGSYLFQRFLPGYENFQYYRATDALQQVLRERAQTFDAARRNTLDATIQRGLREEAPWVFLWQLDESFGERKGVQGFRMRPDELLWVRDVYVQG